MALDWLYGPKIELQDAHFTDVLYTRSLTLDMDTVIELAETLDRNVPGEKAAYFEVTRPPTTPGPNWVVRGVERGELRALSALDRTRLTLRKNIVEEDVSLSLGDVMVNFSQNEPTVYAPARFHPVREQLVEILLANGAPRVQWRRVALRAPYLPVVILAALFVWLELTTTLPAPVHALGWVALVTLAVHAETRVQAAARLAIRRPGHRIRMESRADTAARRADERKNLKVALITAPVTLVVGAAVAVLSGLFTVD